MNHKQKLGYILLGAGIMALGIIIGQFITPNIEAQSGGVFDKITCREIEVVGSKGNKAIVLTSHEVESKMVFYDREEKPAVKLASSVMGNEVLINDIKGYRGIWLNTGSLLTNEVAIFQPGVTGERIWISGFFLAKGYSINFNLRFIRFITGL